MSNPFSVNSTGDNNPEGAHVTVDGNMVHIEFGEDTNVDNEFVLPKAGVYEAVVIDFETGESKSGKPMLTFKFELMGEGSRKAKVFENVVLSMGSRIRQIFFALGMEVEGRRGEMDIRKIIGTKLHLEVYHNEYNDRMYLNVRKFMPHPNGAGTRIQSSSTPNL